jgi:hypothetical protein
MRLVLFAKCPVRIFQRTMEELNENERPVSLLDELSGLIAKKKAENELLKKICEAVSNSDGGKGELPGAGEATTTDIQNQNKVLTQKPKQ